MQTAIMIFRPTDKMSWRMLRLCLRSLRKVSSCAVIIYTDSFTCVHADIAAGMKNVHWKVVDADLMYNRLMLFKVESLYRLVDSVLSDNTQVLCVDTDTYFMADPFQAFMQSFDVGFTSRHYRYQYPINAGVVFVRVNPASRYFLKYAVKQIVNPTWPAYVQWRKRFNRTGVDWYVDQDFYSVAYLNRCSMAVDIKDVGSRFNFCPHADGETTEQGKQEMRDAYKAGDAVVLHLKSRLKELVTEGMFDE